MFGSNHWVMSILGVFAATCAITWHSNIPMAMMLIPLLIYISEKNLFSDKILFLWVCITPLVFIVEYILAVILILGIIPDNMIFTSLTGVSSLFLNMLLLVAVFKNIKLQRIQLQ
jgi:hypothetical protein